MGKAKQMGYPCWRHIRGDGNCYFRAVMNAYIELLIMRDEAGNTLKEFIRR